QEPEQQIAIQPREISVSPTQENNLAGLKENPALQTITPLVNQVLSATQTIMPDTSQEEKTSPESPHTSTTIHNTYVTLSIDNLNPTQNIVSQDTIIHNPPEQKKSLVEELATQNITLENILDTFGNNKEIDAPTMSNSLPTENTIPQETHFPTQRVSIHAKDEFIPQQEKIIDLNDSKSEQKKIENKDPVFTENISKTEQEEEHPFFREVQNNVKPEIYSPININDDHKHYKKTAQMLQYIRTIADQLPEFEKINFFNSDKLIKLEYIIQVLNEKEGLLSKARRYRTQESDTARGPTLPREVKALFLYLSNLSKSLDDNNLIILINRKIEKLVIKL
ncbi:MAG: hypothetical protein ACRC5H_09175, partial [Treponemataceae bacterium]